MAKLLNRIDGKPFDDADEARFEEFAQPISVIFEGSWEITRRQRTA
ncbi:MAG TPA: hypothetical protein VKM54_20790 [Myxococcota bacterium]|nr:hypothetical protein [Myxococcota bacterium]